MSTQQFYSIDKPLGTGSSQMKLPDGRILYIRLYSITVEVFEELLRELGEGFEYDDFTGVIKSNMPDFWQTAWRIRILSDTLRMPITVEDCRATT